jgi:lipopolysaccharide export system protein LptC
MSMATPKSTTLGGPGPEGPGTGGLGAPQGGRAGRPPPRLSGRSAYSLFVSAMKVLLPAVAVGLVLLIVIWPQVEESGGFRLGIVESFTDAPIPEEATMINPRYEGIDENRRPYMITADTARQIEPGDEETIDMERPAADLFDTGGDWMAITADNGVYDRASEVLLLDGNVNVFHDGGYELKTEQAVVDLKNDRATSSTATHGQGSFGTIESEGMRIENRGAQIHFTGKAHMVMYPETSSDGQAEAGQ